jgi:hypothetical protein
MTAVELLHEFQARDVRLTVDGERLSYDAPADAMTEPLLTLLRQHKQALLTLLAQESPPALHVPPETAQDDPEWFAERASMMQYDSGLSRAEAERQAPRHPGGLRLVDASRPCTGCGSADRVQHVTYACCAVCGREATPRVSRKRGRAGPSRAMLQDRRAVSGRKEGRYE